MICLLNSADVICYLSILHAKTKVRTEWKLQIFEDYQEK
jgi:hypothetical protein